MLRLPARASDAVRSNRPDGASFLARPLVAQRFRKVEVTGQAIWPGDKGLGHFRKPGISRGTFFWVASGAGCGILAVLVARIYQFGRTPTLALRRRKARLLRQIKLPPDLLRASYVERFSVCGKRQCRCRHGGAKHGPFYYFTQSLGVGRVNKFLLKGEPWQRVAQDGIAHFRELQEQLEELSQINSELLRREERLAPE